MKVTLKNRWLMVGCVWLVALALTFWNFAEVAEVASTREKNEQTRRELTFQRRHMDKLIRIEKTHDDLFLSTASVNLGIISVRSDLLALAAAFGLEEATFTNDMAQAMDDQIPVGLNIRGPFLKTAAFLAVLEKIPYLQLTHTLFRVMSEKNDAETEIKFVFRYKIKPPAETIEAHSRMITQQPSFGAKPI